MPEIYIPSLAEQRAKGKRLRDRLARTDLAKWKPHRGRDVVATVKKANAGRLRDLIPMKMGRMATSPFAFFRGTAALMAEDLAGRPTTGLNVQLCGDAHVRNLGAYAAPDGHLVFDINDFDETIPGPWEWDLKRLATSFVLAGREAGDNERQCVMATRELAKCYREFLNIFSRMKVLELARYEIHGQSKNEVVREVLQNAQHLTPDRTLKKLTETGKEGWPKFHNRPPLLRHVASRTKESIFAALKTYRETVTAGRQLILAAYHPVDIAFKVVGTGSIGTRDYVALLFGNGLDDPMFLQLKEELPSCYAHWLDRGERIKHQGRRVAHGQQRMQTVTDPFLGWATIEGRPFLVRQLADHKATVDPGELKGATLLEYAIVCGTVLAKAHARTGNAATLSGYCGNSGKFDNAISEFAAAYADQTVSDHGEFLKAIKAGKIKAVPQEKS